MPLPASTDLGVPTDPPPVAPHPPDDDACCGNGCDPCIFDLYNAERERHAAALRAWQQRRAERGRAPTEPPPGGVA